MTSTVSFVDEGVPVASIREVRDGVLSLQHARKTTEAEYRELIDGNRRPKLGDLIYSRNASVGEVGYVATDERFCMGQDVCLITSQSQNQRYLSHQLRSPIVHHQLNSLLVGATFKRINVADIREFLVCCPDPGEQTQIAQRCDAVELQTMRAADAIQTQIAKLREYRQALISAAVTGKIEVRSGEPA